MLHIDVSGILTPMRPWRVLGTEPDAQTYQAQDTRWNFPQNEFGTVTVRVTGLTQGPACPSHSVMSAVVTFDSDEHGKNKTTTVDAYINGKDFSKAKWFGIIELIAAQGIGEIALASRKGK